MKNTLFVFISLIINSTVLSQAKYAYFPNEYNEFIKLENINWAARTHEHYSFLNSKNIKGENIYKHILNRISLNEIYAFSQHEIYGERNDPLSFQNKIIYKKINDSERVAIDMQLYKDSLQTLEFDQIFYLEKYRLKSQIISARPSYWVVTSQGIDLGYGGNFICCINKYDKSKEKNIEAILIKEIQTELDFESLNSISILKETFGMNLSLSLWYGGIAEKLKIYDIKKDSFISPKNIMSYSIFDSTDINEYDSTGNIIKTYKHAMAPVVAYIINKVQFTQKIFYNHKQNYFYSVIDEAYLFVSYNDLSTRKWVTEKRFKILFH